MEVNNIIRIIDRIGAWVVLGISEWQRASIEPNEQPVETAQNIINGIAETEYEVSEEPPETWEDE